MDPTLLNQAQQSFVINAEWGVIVFFGGIILLMGSDMIKQIKNLPQTLADFNDRFDDRFFKFAQKQESDHNEISEIKTTMAVLATKMETMGEDIHSIKNNTAVKITLVDEIKKNEINIEKLDKRVDRIVNQFERSIRSKNKLHAT